MRCNNEGHIVANCPYFFCSGCGMLKEKDIHECSFKLDENNHQNRVIKEDSISLIKSSENSHNIENKISNYVNVSDSLSFSDKVKL